MKFSRTVSLAAFLLLVASQCAPAQDIVAMAAVKKRITLTISAPAHIQAASNIMLNASTTGTVSGLHLLPGEAVRQGQIVARLTGPSVHAETTRLAAEQEFARIKLASVTQTAAIEEQRLGDQLSTNDAVLRARAERDTARQQLTAAQAATKNYANLLSIVAPQPGIVTGVSAADGQVASTGQTLVVIAPTNSLHVVASLYGSDATRVAMGMEGMFRPEGAAAPVHVVVQRMSLSEATPGQTNVWLRPSDGRALPAGAVGSLSLTSTMETLAVPSNALVLDNSRWWVLVHDNGGEHRRAVVPGPSDNGWTAIEQGLKPDEKVVTHDTYLLFHKDFAKRYQQAD